MSWRDHSCGELRPEHVGRRVMLAGWVARRRDHGGLVFVDLRDETGVCQLVVNPEHAAEAAEVAHEVRNEFVLQAEGEVVRALRRDREPGDADRRGRAAGRPARRSSRARRRSRSSSTRRASTRRCASATAGSTCAASSMQRNIRLRAQIVGDDPPRDGGRGLRRHRDADPRQADARGRARLPRAVAPPARPLLRAAAVAADLQAAARDLRLRALLPDRPICFRDEDLRADRVQEITQLDVEMAFPDQEFIFGLMERIVQRSGASASASSSRRRSRG